MGTPAQKEAALREMSGWIDRFILIIAK